MTAPMMTHLLQGEVPSAAGGGSATIPPLLPMLHPFAAVRVSEMPLPPGAVRPPPSSTPPHPDGGSVTTPPLMPRHQGGGNATILLMPPHRGGDSRLPLRDGALALLNGGPPLLTTLLSARRRGGDTTLPSMVAMLPRHDAVPAVVCPPLLLPALLVC